MRFANALQTAGLRLALASSSKNVAAMLRRLSAPDGRSLLSIFDADLSGTDLPRGKPDPALFLAAARALKVPPAQSVVVEDGPAGIAAALGGGMTSVVIAPLGDEALLQRAQADLVVTSLDHGCHCGPRWHLACPADNGDARSCVTPLRQLAIRVGF